MSDMRFLRGMGLGLAVGAATAAAMTMKPKKKSIKAGAGRAFKAMEHAAETVSEHMGM